MSEWKARRFWTAAEVVETESGYGIALDGRPVKTPAKAPLVVPTRALAEEIAAEWQAQEETVRPDRMPATRSANAAIDKVMPQHEEVADLLADYGGTDLLCYRAEGPEALQDRQAAAWDPVLDWAADALGARLVTAIGVMYVPQPQRALDRLRAQVHAIDPFRLTAFHDLVSLSGSLILGFAVTEGFRTAEAAWALSRIDEDWQIEQWGADDEATAQARIKKSAFLHAAAFHTLASVEN